MRAKIIAASLLAALLSTTALADTSSMSTTTTGMGVLANDYVTAGVNGTTGTFGSGGNTSPGLLYDSTGTGTFNTSYDYLTPGSPFDGFAVMVDGTNYTNNNGGGLDIGGDGNGLTDGTNSLSWTGGVASVFDITNTYTLGSTSEYVDISSQITMGVDATDVWFGRFIDPDARAATGDSSSTDNVLGYGVIPDSNVAFSEALSSRYALGLYSTDSNVDAGITGWTTEANSYTENAFDSSSNTNTGDNTIGLSWHWTSVSSGDILTASYAYIFGPSAFDAADTAITGGAGGGDTTTTDSWGTLEDVGSATDAAEGTATPTVTSTSAPTTSYGTWSAWTTNTALPVLTQTQTTHDASETATVQTIDRETTTVVTTPEKRTRTTTTTVVDTYSDGSTVTRTTGTGTETETQNTAVTTVTDPGSFTGRIDQVATAQDVTSSALRTLNFDTVSGVGMNSTMNNGMSGSTKGFQAGAKKESDNGLTVGLGGARLANTLEGNGDKIAVETNAVALSVEKNNVELSVRHAMSDYEISRTIGDFANTAETSGTDTAVSLRYTADEGKIRPIFGLTRGQRTVDAYTEEGSIQSARTVAESNEMYGYATIGGTFDLGDLSITALHHTDGVNDVIVGIEKETEKVTFNLSAQRSMTELGDTNSVFAGVQIKF